MGTDDLISLASLEVACDEGLVPHLGRLEAACLKKSGAERFVLERVLEALRIHLALLQRHPEALWPTLYAHCAFVDSPRARRFGVSVPGPDMPVFAQVARWLEARRTMHPGTPWLKALTPTTPWGGALEAELRATRDVQVLEIDASRVVLSTASGDQSWTPATGVLEPHARGPPARHAFTLRTPKQGGLALERGGESQWLLTPNWTVQGVVISRNGVVAACTAFQDFDQTAFAFDLVRGTQLASEAAGASCVALSPQGRFLAFHDAAGVTIVRSLADGRVTGVASDPPTSLAVSDDGHHVAQVEAGLVRRYRPHPGPWPACFVRERYPTRFSRDGSRILLGQYVLDGSDGSVLVRHDFTPPDFLEGGPPRTGLRLTRNRLCVDELLRVGVFDFGTMQRRVLPTRAGLGRRVVAWSGDGAVYAAAREGDRQVLRVDLDARRVDESGPIQALALDETGSLLACLLVDGTITLQPGGPALRQVPRGRRIAFVAKDTALAVSGADFTVVLGLDGLERWRSREPLELLDADVARLEVEAGLRAPSVAEALGLTFDDGLLWADGVAAFPAVSTGTDWLRSPGGSLLARDTTLLSYERS